MPRTHCGDEQGDSQVIENERSVPDRGLCGEAGPIGRQGKWERRLRRARYIGVRIRLAIMLEAQAMPESI